jgi:hypothetical protein
MGITEPAFLTLLILFGIGFQLRMWRELMAKRLVGAESGIRQRGVGFYPFGLLFCCGVQALAAHTYVASRSDSSTLAITIAVVTAMICLGMSFGIARLWPSAKMM